MIVFTALFDALMAFTGVHFAKHLVNGAIIVDLFGAKPAIDKALSEMIFEGLLYFAAMCFVELFIINRFATLRGLAFYPKDFQDEKENLTMCHGNRTKQKIVIAIGFIALILVNVAMYIFL